MSEIVLQRQFSSDLDMYIGSIRHGVVDIWCVLVRGMGVVALDTFVLVTHPFRCRVANSCCRDSITRYDLYLFPECLAGLRAILSGLPVPHIHVQTLRMSVRGGISDVRLRPQGFSEKR